MDLPPEQRDILLHALGYNYEPRHDRNHYCVNIEQESDTTRAMAGLVALGLMAARRTLNEGRDQYFTATDAGKALAPTLLPPKPKLTRSQRRYRDYMRAAADFMTFKEYLQREKEIRQ